MRQRQNSPINALLSLPAVFCLVTLLGLWSLSASMPAHAAPDAIPLSKSSEESILAEDKLREAAAHWELSTYYWKKWDLELAEAELELSTIADPGLQIAHRDLCLVSLLRLNLPRSFAEFLMTVGLAEPLPYNESESQDLIAKTLKMHYKRAMAFARQKKWQDAIEEFRWAESLDPEDFSVHRSIAFAYANLGQFKLAEEEYKKAASLTPQTGNVDAELADLLAEHGKIDAAQKHLSEAIRKSPQTIAYHVDLGWLAEQKGDLETASREFRTAVSLNPSHAGLWEHLGEILEKKGSPNEAITAYEKAIELDPDKADIKATLERLSKLDTRPPV